MQSDYVFNDASSTPHEGISRRHCRIFFEKDKIAFADSKTVPVIKDGDTPVKDSWAIAQHLEPLGDQ